MRDSLEEVKKKCKGKRNGRGSEWVWALLRIGLDPGKDGRWTFRRSGTAKITLHLRLDGSQKDNETIKIHVPFILFSKNLWPAAQPLRSSRTFQHIEVEGACPLAPTRQMKMAFGSILKIPRSPRQMESRGMNPNPKKPTRNPEITCRHDT